MSLTTLQKNIGVTVDGKFGKNTFREAAKYLNIDNHAEAVHFFAQCSHETGGFHRFVENLNYSYRGLLRTFPKYFKSRNEAINYDRNPSAIASRVYANRMGNGNELSGDGWKYRGRGALQTTGYDNYKELSEYLNDISILATPNIVSDKYAFESAVFYFYKNNLWSICREGFREDTIKKLTKRINGGYNGLDHRIELTKEYSKFKL